MVEVTGSRPVIRSQKQTREEPMAYELRARWAPVPGAYKDIADVIARQTDLVEVVHHLKQVVCVKG